MGGELLAPILEVTISKVISVATEHLNSVVGYKEELTSLLSSLKLIMGVFQDAKEKQAAKHPGVKAWLEELWLVVEEADVLVDQISYQIVRHQVTQKQSVKVVRYFFTLSNHLAVRRSMASKVYNLDVAFCKLKSQASEFGLQNLLANPRDLDHRKSIQQTDSSLLVPSEIIGREVVTQEIVKLLIDSGRDQPLGVVSIVGMGGVGKTSLAKLVCNDDRIKKHFSKIMWVCVPEKFDVLGILGEMLQSLSRNSFKDVRDQDALVVRIRELLEEQNYLLVLDDVWWIQDVETWENLRDCLFEITENVGSSRVLVTTRSFQVVSMMGSVHIDMRCLDDYDCWSIIKQRSFGNSVVPIELEEIGMKIAIKCRGLPLAANVLAGTLGRNKNTDHWLSIEKKLDECGSYLFGDLLPLLKLGFDPLPPALKLCFAICSIFPYNVVLEREMLIQLWMAEGFLQTQDSNQEMEDIGNEYFEILVSCSFFQDVEQGLDGRIISCKMHALMRDLAKLVSKSQTAVLEHIHDNDIHKVRHLNLLSAPSMGENRMMKAFKQLSSLFLKVDVFCDTPITFKRLLVLSFRGADIYQLPTFLGKLQRLRYFDISDTNITEFPKFINELYLLQTFRFINCRFLNRPLEALQNLVHLKHIYFEDGTHTAIQTLEVFDTGCQKGRRIEELGYLSRLKGSLKICNLGDVTNKAEAERARLYEKTAITALTLDFGSELDGKQDHDDILEGLKPPSNLKDLTIEVFAGRNCPSWMVESNSTCLSSLLHMAFLGCYHLNSIPSLSLSSLVSMKFFGCDELESIGPLSLNSAARLEILNCRVLTNVAVSSLRDLIIEDCHELVSIHSEPQIIASLNEIDIQRCNKLERLPVIGGLSSLQILRIRECCKLISIGDSDSFASICLKEVTLTDCGNLQSIPNVDGTSLQKLVIRSCDKLVGGGVGKYAMESLKEINIKKNCSEMDIVPVVSGSLSLEMLHLEECLNLGGLKDSGFFASTRLVKLTLHRCDDLVFIPSLEQLSSLETIVIKHCQELQTIAGGSLSSSTRLKSLTIWHCPALTSIPSLLALTSLQKLCIVHCGLKGMPSGLSSLLRLSALELGGFVEELEEFPDLSCIVHLENSLESLTLYGWEKLKYLPNEIQHLTSLKELEIRNFGELEGLPDWFCNLSFLQCLELRKCNSLMYMPSMEAMRSLSNLKRLVIHSCPDLKVSCARESGSEWHKISHIPYIAVEGRVVQKSEASREVGLTTAADGRRSQLTIGSRSFLQRLRNSFR